MVTAMVAVGSAAPAVAQLYHGGSHYHYQPGHYDYHNGHYDYHGPTYRQPPTVYVQPQPSYVAPGRPAYVSPPRTTYYGGDDHSHEHADPHRPRQVTYGGFSRVDDLAAELEDQANELCLELHYNYQHNAGFRQTYKEAYEILTTAKYIHGLEHAGNRDKLRQALGELDALFHHVEGHAADWTGHHRRQVGYGGLTAKLEAVEQTLHHLMDDVGVRPDAQGEQAPPADGGFESAPPAAEIGPPPADSPLVIPN